MNELRFSTISVLILLVLAAWSLPTSAQQLDLEGYPEVELDEIDAEHRDWFEKEVHWILTPTERDVFVRLTSAQQRDTFIEEFWQQRDPTPGTPRNEYFDEYQRRLEHVNKFFGRGTFRDGWQTDRGRMYLLLGAPVYTSGVPNDMITYPTETWFYAGATELGLPAFFYLLFYQRYGQGDFVIYSPLSDGPEKLLNPAGGNAVEDMKQSRQQTPGFAPSGFRNPDIEYIYYLLRDIDIDLASAAISLFPSEAGLEFGITPLRSEMLLGDIQQVPERLMPDTTYAYNVLTGITDSEVRFETLLMEARAIPLIDVDGRPFVHFAAETPGDNLNLNEYQENYYFSFDSSGSVVTKDSKVLQIFDANMSGELDPEAARRFRNTQFLYMDMVPTVAGEQVFEVVIENKVAHSFGRQVFDIQVPSIHPETVQILGPVLGAAIRENEEYDPFAQRFPFQYRSQSMVPSVTHEYARGAPIVVFAQFLLPQGHDRPLQLRLELIDPSGGTAQQLEQQVGLELADEHGVIAAMLTLTSDALNVGEYSLRMTLVDEPAGSAVASLQIVEPQADPGRPFINAQPSPPPTDVTVFIERARQHQILGQMEDALVLLRDAHARDPENGQVIEAYVDTLDAAEAWDELIEFVGPLVARNARATDGMVMLARAHANLGQHYDAIRYYERTRIALGEDTVEILNPLATQYAAEGRVDKARELLARSLELNSEQPEIQRMLDRISQTDAAPAQ